MTLDELNSLRFNMPIMSTIDNSLWYYDCRFGNSYRIFKSLTENSLSFDLMGGRRTIYRTKDSPWKREGGLTVSEQMMLEDFELVYKVVKAPDISIVKKNKDLVIPYSILKPNFHMMELPF